MCYSVPIFDHNCIKEPGSGIRSWMEAQHSTLAESVGPAECDRTSDCQRRIVYA